MAGHGHYSLEGRFLKLDGLRGLLVQNAERRRKIVRRCNWYMFSNPEIRGHIGRINEFFRLCQTAISNPPSEQEKPNEEIAKNPPSQSFYLKYFEPHPEGSPYWLMRQDLISAKSIHNILSKAWERWKNVSTRAAQVSEAIDSISRPKRIKSVVCLGLGPILTALPHSLGEDVPDKLSPRNVAQHCLAIAVVKQLERKTGRRISLYTADLGYTPQHRVALESSTIAHFVVLDPSYGKHEQFAFIDDNTMVVDFTGPPDCPAMSIIQEYARPAAIITSEIPQRGPYQDRQWFEVTEKDGNKVKVPGCANLPLPDGINIGTLCPKRVRDMMVHEYRIERKFPAEDPNLERTWGQNDLVDYGSRDRSSADGGYYWFSDTRPRYNSILRYLGRQGDWKKVIELS